MSQQARDDNKVEQPPTTTPSNPGGAPLASLPISCLQRIFQFVSQHSNPALLLARCSRTSALNPAAWAGEGMPLVRISTAARLQLPGSFPQHALANVPLVSTGNGVQLAAVMAWLPRVHSLQLQTRATTDEQWNFLWTHPSLQSVRRIHVFSKGNLSTRCIQLMAGLPQLAELTLMTNAAASDLTPLSLSASLSRLSIWPPNGVVPLALAQCPKLRELELKRPLVGAELVAFFRQPQMATQLQRLSLFGQQEYLRAAAAVQHLPAIFSALTALHTLDLSAIVNVDLLLLHVARCPSLRLLRIHSPVPHPHTDVTGYLISPPLLCELLTSSPQLRIQVQVREEDLLKYWCEGEADNIAAITAMWNALRELPNNERWVARGTLVVGTPPDMDPEFY